MAKHEIEIPDSVLSDTWEAVEFRPPRSGDYFLSESGCKVITATDAATLNVRLIVRKKEVPRKVRSYNAKEMKSLYLGRARLVTGSESHDVTGHDAGSARVKIDGQWWSAIELRGVWNHLDGSGCEVVE